MKKFLIIPLLLCLNLINTYGQHQKEILILHFNNSKTIQVASNLVNGLTEGYAINFDSLGNPTLIGEYKNGLPYGIWLSSVGEFIDFNNSKYGKRFLPGCGTGIHSNVIAFKKLYALLLSGKTRIDLQTLFE